jgi:Domain of unknown function (DUF4328)
MKTNKFKSAHRLAVVTVILLGIDVFCYFVEIIYNLVFLAFFPDLGESIDPSAGEIVMGIAALGLISLKVLAYIATIVFFLMWLYRAYKNLEAFNVQGLEATPGWAVGYWFLPIVNLFKPLKVVNEVHHGSKPEHADQGYGFSATHSTMLTGLWWACWLLSNFTGNIAGVIERAAKDVTGASIVVVMISLGFGIVAGVLLIFIVREIDADQTEFVEKTVNFAPPEPPVFDRFG